MLFVAEHQGAKAITETEVAVYAATSQVPSSKPMYIAPWCSVTFSLRRFTLCAIGLFTVLGVLCPFAPNYESLLTG